MNDYSKTIGIKFEVNNDSVEKVKKSMTDVAKSSKEDLKKEIEQLRENLDLKLFGTEEVKKKRQELKGLQKELNKMEFKEGFSDFSQGLKEGFNLDKKGFNWKQAGKDFSSEIASVLKNAKDMLVDVLKDAWAELDNILQYSLLSNEHTRNLAFTYGFSGSQAYGYDKAMGIMGLQSQEDLMYLNPQQRQKFFESMTHFTEKYNDLYNKGFFDEYLDFQYEMAEFKEDVKLEIVQFFMNNKDLIKDGMKAIMILSKGALEALTNIVKFLGINSRDTSDRVAASTDIVNSYANNSRTTDIKIDNTFNNVAKQDQGWLVNAGMKVTEQIVQAFN